MTKICTIPGCEKKHNARGWCSTHYNNWKRRGDPLQFADPKVTKKKQSDSAKKRIKRDGFSPGMQRKGEPGLQKGKKRGPSSQKGKKRGPMPKKTKQKISKSKTGTTPNFSDEDRQRRKQRWTGENNPNFGGLTDQHKSKIGITRKKGFRTGKIKSHRKGTHHTPEAKEKNRQKHLGKVHTDKAKKNMSIAQNKPETLQANRERGASQTPTRGPTIPEILMREMLENIGVKFEKQYPIKEPPCKPDFFIKPNICIFTDGDWIHANPNPFVIPSRTSTIQPGYKPNDVIHGVSKTGKSRKKPQYAKDIRKHDKKITKELKENGYEVIRFYHSYLENHPEECIQKIKKAIKSN